MEHVTDRYNATLTGRIAITPRLAIFQVTPDAPGYQFVPGQFTTLGLTYSAPRLPEADPDDYPPEKAWRLLRRAYSITSGSGERYLEFYISLVTSGQFTPRLFNLPVGERLALGGQAKGLFTLERVAAGKPVVMIATGTGLAPYISMLRGQVLGEGCPTRRVAVVHGASYSWDLGYRGELESLAAQCDHFRYLPVISRPEGDPTWRGRTGRLMQWLTSADLTTELGFAPDPTQADALLCGHPGMVEEAMAWLAERGFVPDTPKTVGSLHVEKYW